MTDSIRPAGNSTDKSGGFRKAWRWVRRRWAFVGIGSALLLAASGFGLAWNTGRQAAEAKREVSSVEETHANEVRRLLDLTRLSSVQTLLDQDLDELAWSTLSEIAPDNRCVVWGMLQQRLNRKIIDDRDDKQHIAADIHGLETFAHLGWINQVSFSPDGRRIVTASNDNTAVVWDADTGVGLVALRGHKGSVRSVRFSPDGRRVVSGGSDGQAIVWDAVSGRKVFELGKHGGVVSGVAFSLDGRKIGTLASDNLGFVWDADTGAKLFPIGKGVPRATELGDRRFIAFSPDSSHVATMERERHKAMEGEYIVRIWDTSSGRLLKEGMTIANAGPSSLQYFADGRKLAAGELLFPVDGRPPEEKALKWWTPPEGISPIFGIAPSWGWAQLAHSPQPGKILCLNGSDTLVMDYLDPESKDDRYKQALRLPKQTSRVTCGDYSPDGRRVVTGSEGCTASVWDATTGELLVELGGMTKWREADAGLQRKRRKYDDLTDREGSLEPGDETIQAYRRKETVLRVAFPATGDSLVATGSTDCTARVWDTETGRAVCVCRGHAKPVLALAFSPDGRRLATAAQDHTIRLWDTASGQALAVMPGLNEEARDVAFSPDGAWLAVWYPGGQCRMWATGIPAPTDLIKLRGDSTAGWHTTDGRLIGTLYDGTVRVWDTRTGQQQASLRFSVHYGGFHGSAFSPDATRLALAGCGNVTVWDITTGEEVLAFTTETCQRGIAFSADGTRLLTSLEKPPIHIWDAKTGAHIGEEKNANPLKDEYPWRMPDGRQVFTRHSTDRNVLRTFVYDPSPNPAENLRRRLVGEPGRGFRVDDPQAHITAAEAYKADLFAADVQKSLEQKARGRLALDAGEIQRAFGHYLAAEIIRPKPASPDVPKRK